MTEHDTCQVKSDVFLIFFCGICWTGRTSHQSGLFDGTYTWYRYWNGYITTL